MEPKQTQSPSQGRQKMSYACEACRAAKTKCQSGPQPGICKRCSEFKRECIFRTGPRTRRPKAYSRVDAELANLPPPPGPSKTFSIDFDMPAAEDPSDDFEMLRQQHERFLEELVPNDDAEEDGGEQQIYGKEAAVTTGPFGPTKASSRKTQTFSFNDMSSSSPSVSMSGISSSWTESSSCSAETPAILTGGGGLNPEKKSSKPMMNLGIKPQFNLDSASKLLASFRHMLPHLPCLVLPEDVDVRSLARGAPFVLLAILAVTSCSSSLQGHSLYDEEFRKVLGLKFVAGGERSLELLQGILIYCAWYPFHLRPKNKQSYQYLKMAVDIVHDLELEQEGDLNLFAMAPEQRARKLDNLRALLGCFYGISTYASTWGRPSTLRYNPQLARCAELLEHSSVLEQDQHLVWLVRLQYIFEELVEAQRTFDRGFRDAQSEMQRNLIRAGLEAQFRDFKERMPEKYASTSSIFLQVLLTDTYLLAPALIRTRRKSTAKEPSEAVTAERLLCAARKVRTIFDHITALPARELSGFCGADYGRFIIAIILAYRLSFPVLSICRDYDVARGRRILDFGELLRGIVDSSPADDDDDDQDGVGKLKAKKKTDTASALKVVLRSVRTKYEEKSVALEAISSAATGAATGSSGGEDWAARDMRSTCPMLNGTLDQYIPLWAGQQAPLPTAGSSSYATSQTGSSSVMTDTLSGLGEDAGTAFAGPMGQMGLGMGTGMGMGMGTGAFEDKPLLYHDLWATMTMGWAGDLGEVNMEDFGNTGFGEMADP